MTTLENGLWARGLRPRYGIVHLAVYTSLMVLLATWLGRVVNRQEISGLLEQMHVLIAETPIPEVLIVQDPLVLEPAEYHQDYDFTSDWFSPHVPVWKAALSSFQGKPDIRYLEIGLFEGRSALWMLENILTHPTARMTGLDIFEGPLKERYLANISLSGATDKVTTIVDFSQIALRTLPLNSFDIVYIDGSHDENDVLEDAVLSWRLLKEGGLLIFDDYRWLSIYLGPNIAVPKVAIDAFYRSFESHLEVIHNSSQLILTKKSVP